MAHTVWQNRQMKYKRRHSFHWLLPSQITENKNQTLVTYIQAKYAAYTRIEWNTF